MDLATITVSDFKAQFPRDFPYLNTWKIGKAYKTGDVVYYAENQGFYKSKVAGNTSVPTDATKWDPIDDSTDNYVTDCMITNAMLEAEMMFNQGFFGEDRFIKLAYLYLTASYLINDIRATMGGVLGGISYAVASRSVGNVSESYAIPKAYIENPQWAFLTQNPYGSKYLQMILPMMVGNVGVVAGRTQP